MANARGKDAKFEIPIVKKMDINPLNPNHNVEISNAIFHMLNLATPNEFY